MPYKDLEDEIAAEIREAEDEFILCELDMMAALEFFKDGMIVRFSNDVWICKDRYRDNAGKVWLELKHYSGGKSTKAKMNDCEIMDPRDIAVWRSNNS